MLASTDPQNPDWKTQESVAFADNWTVGLSFFHNVFAREHNQFVDEFRRRGDQEPNADSGLRDPDHPNQVIRRLDVSAEDLFQVARLVVAAEIAKIHTIEWTTQLLYNEPLYRGMNGNWNGLLNKASYASRELAKVVARLQSSKDPKFSNQYYSVLAAGPGSFADSTDSSFDDFINQKATAQDRSAQAVLVGTLRELYGQHICDSSIQITVAQRDPNGNPINDCLGRPNHTFVDNIEDLDTMVGWLAESTRPHGFAISETQFVVFILNASRRLYSDRFFTSSFRPEFYSKLGIDWVNNNGPQPMCETFPINGHSNEPVSPLKRILLRTMPELSAELSSVANAFDPWARDRGRYYSFDWKPRLGAESDPAFTSP